MAVTLRRLIVPLLFLGAALSGGYGAFAVAFVGQPVQFAIEQKQPDAVDQLVRNYKRPQTIPFPPDNPYTLAKSELGKTLYFDPLLSANGNISCGSCHHPGLGWGDGLPKGVGHGMKILSRRSPSIIDAAWGQTFFWDGREASLESQALGPVTSEVEMNLPLDVLVARLSAIPGYVTLFAVAFPGEGVQAATIAKALSTYERTLVSGRTAFDDWTDGDAKAISAEAQRGFVLFNTKAKCASCHEGWSFTNNSYHDIGLPDGDLGRGRLKPKIVKMQHAFKTPGLREIGRRAPYMHDGSLATLADVVEHYDRGGIDRVSRSDLMQPLKLTTAEKSDILAFLDTLTSAPKVTAVPNLPRQ